MAIEFSSTSDTLTQVRTIVAEQLGRDLTEVAAESRIVQDLGADSLDIAELLLVLEEAFGRDISDWPTRDLVTVGDVAAFLGHLTKTGATAGGVLAGRDDG